MGLAFWQHCRKGITHLFYVSKTLNTAAGAFDFVLVEDNWDDWFTYETTYSLHYFDEEQERVRIGSVKIGQSDMEKEQRRADLP
jgi:hypothetical protein